LEFLLERRKKGEIHARDLAVHARDLAVHARDLADIKINSRFSEIRTKCYTYPHRLSPLSLSGVDAIADIWVSEWHVTHPDTQKFPKINQLKKNSPHQYKTLYHVHEHHKIFRHVLTIQHEMLSFLKEKY